MISAIRQARFERCVVEADVQSQDILRVRFVVDWVDSGAGVSPWVCALVEVGQGEGSAEPDVFFATHGI